VLLPDIILPIQLQPAVVRVAIDAHSELQILSASVWYYTTPSVATRHWFVLQLIYTLSCKYWMLSPDTVLLVPLQLDSGSSCNWYTLQVENTKCFRLILYYPFSCNRIVVWVAIDVDCELQIMSVSTWYYNPTVVRIAIGESNHLQLRSSVHDFLFIFVPILLSGCN
jgi:hypothetical protein